MKPAKSPPRPIQARRSHRGLSAIDTFGLSGRFLGAGRVCRLCWHLLTRCVDAATPATLLKERVAQLVEHLTFNQEVMGSNPIALTNEIKDLDRKTNENAMMIAIRGFNGASRSIRHA